MSYSKLLIATVIFVISGNAAAFCGFYVAKAGSKLFNKSSQVVLVRDEDKTVMTMANDYQGNAKEFAMVIPVPTVLKKKQIHVTENKIIEHLDAYTAPRLVEYFDSDPCAQKMRVYKSSPSKKGGASIGREGSSNKSLGVKVEAEYQVGEYDIKILSAKNSSGLLTWLNSQKYQVPAAAKSVLRSYIKQGLKFFVAKVNLERLEKSGFSFLRPIQIAYQSKRFMLPIRLGMVNAKGPQDLFIYTLTRKGRVEATNYRTSKIPSGMDIPVFVKKDFSKFYTDMFTNQVEKNDRKSVILEYAWNMSWCDPCAADPLSNDELRQLGTFWIESKGSVGGGGSRAIRKRRRPMPTQDVYVTRLHVRYDKKHFPEDLRFQVTANKKNYQGRYVLRHPFSGKATCEAAKSYRQGIALRQEKEAKNLASLTGWKIEDIRKKISSEQKNPAKPDSEDWIDGIWKKKKP